ncbi:MAG: transposase [Gemmatimonadetes bacterium]|nr:transposase [Gemmatimonadota bacterium]
MKGKRKYTDEQIVAILFEHRGVTAKEVIRRHGIALDTFYRWKRQYSGMTKAELQRLKAWRTRTAGSSAWWRTRALNIQVLKDALGKSGDAGSAAGSRHRDPCAAGAPAAARLPPSASTARCCSTGRGRRPRRRCASGWASWRWHAALGQSAVHPGGCSGRGGGEITSGSSGWCGRSGCSWASAPAEASGRVAGADADADPPGPALEHGLRATRRPRAARSGSVDAGG